MPARWSGWASSGSSANLIPGCPGGRPGFTVAVARPGFGRQRPASDEVPAVGVSGCHSRTRVDEVATALE